MSAAKRATVRVKKVTKKTSKKVVRKRAIVKKTIKKVAKKVTKRTGKQTAKKTTNKVTKRVLQQPKNAAPQSVREARFGGHSNTLPTNPKAPGRLLGRSFTLGLAGTATTYSFNPDVIAIAVARFGGIGVMVCGAALSWSIYNQLVVFPDTSAVAAVIEAPAPPSISVTTEGVTAEPVSFIVNTPQADAVFFVLETGEEHFVLGAAAQRTSETWEYRFDPQSVLAGTYSLRAIIETANDYQTVLHGSTIEVGSPPVAELPLVTEMVTTASSTLPTADSAMEEVLIAPTTTMPTLLAPIVHSIAPESRDTAIVIGEGTPNQPLELLLLREQRRATTTVQPNGWWSLTIPTPKSGAQYELYAQANEELLSGPLDFSVISGRLTRLDQQDSSPATVVSSRVANRDLLVWYLVVSVGIVALGTVLLLLGHHLYYLRRREEDERPLDQVA
jgi:hypothetical protein